MSILLSPLAADHGNVHAQYNHFREGFGISNDHVESVRYMKLAAGQD